jgi:hypothetical protein
MDLGRAGSLGLSVPDTGCLFRGLRDTYRNNRPTGSSEFLPNAEMIPHRIWFHERQRLWLEHLSRTSEEAAARTRIAALRTSDILLGEFSEWVEQQGQSWEDFPEIHEQDPYDWAVTSRSRFPAADTMAQSSCS